MKALPKILLALTGVAALSLAYPASVQANPTTYQYTGNFFTSATGAYTTSDFVTVMLTLPGPLRPNVARSFDLTNPPLEIIMRDGVQILSLTNADYMQLTLYTDGTGAIGQWAVSLGHLVTPVGIISTANVIVGPDAFVIEDDARNDFHHGLAGNELSPGEWRLVATGVPDAGSTLSLMTLTLMALGLVARRFQRAAG